MKRREQKTTSAKQGLDDDLKALLYEVNAGLPIEMQARPVRRRPLPTTQLDLSDGIDMAIEEPRPRQLVRYDAMCRAITEAYQVDEVKDIRDRAIALEEYARQAKNEEMVRQCAEIRLRAERRAGQLLAVME